MWWDDDSIERTVTRQFVCAHLLPDEIARLDRPLAFGDGLTDGTYWEWIDQKAKRLFLLLVDLHVPDQIFGVIDDSWDDADLPVARDHVARLALTPTPDDRFDRKFYYRQFYYLLRPLERSDHVAVYDDTEIVPLDVVDRSSGSGGGSGGGGGGGSGTGSHHHHRSNSHGGGGTTGGGGSSTGGYGSGGSGTNYGSSSIDRVMLPNYPGMVFSRRRVPLAPEPGVSAYGAGHVSREAFQHEVQLLRRLHPPNEHLVSFWTAYVHQGVGYVLCTPAAGGVDGSGSGSGGVTVSGGVSAVGGSSGGNSSSNNHNTLKALLANTPAAIKALSTRARRQLVVNWIHCLVDTLCFVHSRGLSHGNLKPSTVMFTQDYRRVFLDVTHVGADAGGGIFAAAAAALDKASFDKESYDYAAPEQWYRPSGSMSGMSGSGSGGSGSSSGSSSGGGHIYSIGSSRKNTYIADDGASSSGSTGRGGSVYGGNGLSTSPEAAAAAAAAYVPQLNPQAADVFSLGCIILELLGFLLKRPTRTFAAHRAAKHKTPGRGGAVLDASFHKNLGQVESWMAGLAREAASASAAATAKSHKKLSALGKKSKPSSSRSSSSGRKKSKSDHDPGDDDQQQLDDDKAASAAADNEDRTLAGVAPMLQVVARMLALHASERPAAYDLQTRMYAVVRDDCGIAEPHCVHEYGSVAGVALGSRPLWNDAYHHYDYYGGGGGGSSSWYGGSSNGSSGAGSSPAAAVVPGLSIPRMSSRSSSSARYDHYYYYQQQQQQQYQPASVSPLQRQHATQLPYAQAQQKSGARHGRTDSAGSGGSVRSGASGASGASTSGGDEDGEARPDEDGNNNNSNNNSNNNNKKGHGTAGGLASGLQALRNLQIRDKVRPSWNAPVFAA